MTNIIYLVLIRLLERDYIYNIAVDHVHFEHVSFTLSNLYCLNLQVVRRLSV